MVGFFYAPCFICIIVQVFSVAVTWTHRTRSLQTSNERLSVRRLIKEQGTSGATLNTCTSYNLNRICSHGHTPLSTQKVIPRHEGTH